MSYRIWIGEFAHETNTFCRDLTGTEGFKSNQWEKGEEMIRAHTGNRTYVGGMIDRAGELGVTAVPGLATWAMPSGTISRAAYEEIMSELLSSIEAAMPLDGVCISLHGAGVAEGIDDLEGAVLAAIRRLVGPRVRIAAPLDLHGNITQAMLDLADGLFGVHLYPHTDSYERGAEALGFLVDVLEGKVRPAMHLETLPMMIPTTTTDLDPGRKMNELCWELEKETPGLLDVAVFHGFPYTDVPCVGVSVLAVANGDRAVAERAARTVARAIWEAREEYRPQSRSVHEAIDAALAVSGQPVVINDTSDNPGGGSPGDSTHLLRAMIERRLESACYGFIFDPEVAAQAHAAGVGATIRVCLGGKTDDLHGAPIETDAYVRTLADGRFRLTSEMWKGYQFDLGKTARLVIGGIDVIVSSVRSQTLDPEVFLLHGIDVARYKVVALKSSQHFRAGFRHLAAAIIAADAPGATTLQLQGFPHKRIARPIWPLDAGASYPR